MSDEIKPVKPTPRQEKFITIFFERLYTIAEALDHEQREYKKLLEDQVALRGKILTYHLVTEQLLIQELAYLASQHKLKLKKRIDKMVYSEKLQALPRQIAYTSLRKGLKELNEMRNLMAHNLDFVPSYADIPLIQKFLEPYFKDSPEQRPSDLEGYIYFFVKVCIGIFASRSGNTRKPIDKFLRTFPKAKGLFKLIIE